MERVGVGAVFENSLLVTVRKINIATSVADLEVGDASNNGV